jgi:hypothetical protein
MPTPQQYFQNITTLPALKKERKRLAKLHHPDVVGGSNTVMQEINAEYERVRDRLSSSPPTPGNIAYTYPCPRQQGRQEMPWAEYWNDMLNRIRRRQDESEVEDDDDYSGD